MPHSGPGQSLTLVGYSSVLPRIIWSQAIYIRVLISLITIGLPDRALSFSIFCMGVMKRERFQMVMLLGAVCWCRESWYIPTKCALLQIMHRTREQIIIQCHDKNIWKQMCIKTYLIVLKPIFDTMHKGKKQVKKYIWVLYHELVIFLQSRNCLCYVPDNDIKGDILGWTLYINRPPKNCPKNINKTPFTVFLQEKRQFPLNAQLLTPPTFNKENIFTCNLPSIMWLPYEYSLPLSL